MSLSSVVITAKDTPFNETEDASAKLENARQNAVSRNVPLLIMLGGNWCPDARLLSATLEHNQVEELLNPKFETVQIDVGKYERNQAIHTALGFSKLEGLPAVIVQSPNGEILNSNSVFAWRDARNIPTQEFVDKMLALSNN
ncbi:thioredoxin family protein [Hirschia maritima]|uniref:thioredoxin family protein n=1 Tax=Hirschia maritima TaxID=1121961 RepID=UPI00035D3479|nr:thioredoxin family protein [Hirschia maritima]